MRIAHPLATVTATLSLAAALGLAGCGASPSATETATTDEIATEEQLDETTKGQAGTMPYVTDYEYDVDLGTSELYTEAARETAVKAIMADFNQWTGCTMLSVRYESDQASADSLAYCNELRAEGSTPYTGAIVFKTDFKSPNAELAKGTAWEPDTVYKDYEWYLAHTNNGPWEVVTYGY